MAKQKAPVVRVLGVQARPDHITVQVGKDRVYTYEASPYIGEKIYRLVQGHFYGKALQELRKCPLVRSMGKDRNEHRYHGSPGYACRAESDPSLMCGICMGGLRSCDICKGAEAGLPTQCPGRALTDGEMVGISDKVLDFRRGAWVSL